MFSRTYILWTLTGLKSVAWTKRFKDIRVPFSFTNRAKTVLEMNQNLHTLDSGKKGPRFINFWITVLLEGLCLSIFILSLFPFFFNGCMEFKVGASFIQKATFNILPNFLGTTFIPCPSFILESLVSRWIAIKPNYFK